MIEWYDKLYMDERVKKNLKKYKGFIEKGKRRIPSLYCVALASNKENLFDVISCNELWFDHYRKSRIFIVGLAADYQNALNLLQTMVLDMYRHTGNFKADQYFMNEE